MPPKLPGLVHNILVRLPNWLGDMLMSAPFMAELSQRHPEAQIEVIAQSSLKDLAALLPGVTQVHAFERKAMKGALRPYRLGKQLGKSKRYDQFWSLPDSLSSALMARGSGARERIGYGGQGRNQLLTKVLRKNNQYHRADQYLALAAPQNLVPRSGQNLLTLPRVVPQDLPDAPYLVCNFNSVAESRRMPVGKAASLLKHLHQIREEYLILIGGPGEEEHVKAIEDKAGLPDRVQNRAGGDSLLETSAVISGARGMITTDSGPAHMANALGTPSVVFFGAGDENETGPYNSNISRVMRVSGLPCAPCIKNDCALQHLNCLHQLSEDEMTRLAAEVFLAP